MSRRTITSLGSVGILTSIGLLLMVAGCASEAERAEQRGPTPPPAPRMESVDLQVPPKQLVETVKQVVSSPPWSLGVEKQDKGTIITGFKTYPGTWHIARRWQERTRFVITVIPDWDAPTAQSRLQISEETQQRAADVQEWQNAPELVRPERTKELMDAIRAKVK